MKVVVNVCLPPMLAEGLRNAGHHAQHWADIGDPTAADKVIMNWALAHSCVIITHDLDFNTLLHGTRGSGPSVVIFRGVDTSVEAVLPPLLRVLAQFQVELLEGALISMGVHMARIRHLPLG